MKVFITKYALTAGIKEFELLEEVKESPGMIIVKTDGIYPSFFHGEGKDWHRTIEAAEEKRREMARNRLASLEKQIKVLNAIIYSK